MRFTKVLADGYGISEDYAILVEATWHRDTPTQDELSEVPYYDHKQRLPEGVAEFVVTSRARRAINDGVDLQEIVDRISRLDKSPHQKQVLDLNEMLKTHNPKWMTPSEKRRHILEMGRVGFQILKHAAIYQKQILKHEHDGILPRKVPQMIVQEVNQLRQELGK